MTGNYRACDNPDSVKLFFRRLNRVKHSIYRYNIFAGDIGASFLIREIIGLLKYQRGVARTARLEEEEKVV
jgi:hypothetical protein